MKMRDIDEVEAWERKVWRGEMTSTASNMKVQSCEFIRYIMVLFQFSLIYLYTRPTSSLEK